MIVYMSIFCGTCDGFCHYQQFISSIHAFCSFIFSHSCRLDWAMERPGIWLNTTSGYVWEGASGWDWISRESKTDCPAPQRVGEPQPVPWRPKQNKRLSKKEFLFSTWLSSSWDISPAFGLGLQLEFIPSSFLVLRPSDSGWKYPTGSLGCPAGLGLLSLHDCMSKFLLVICIYWFCHCGEPKWIYSPRQRPRSEGKWWLYSQGQQQNGGCTFHQDPRLLRIQSSNLNEDSGSQNYRCISF